MIDKTSLHLTRTPSWAKGMQKIGPGIYIRKGELHVSGTELCEAVGQPPTPENLRIVNKLADQLIREQFPDAPPAEIVDDDPQK